MKALFILISIIIQLFCFCINSFAQRNVITDTLTNDATGVLKFITNDSVRMIITDSSDIIINGNLVFLDTTSSIHVDSLRCRVIHVGDSSIVIGITPQLGGNNIYSNDGNLLINCNNAFQFNTILENYLAGRVGIGTNTPQNKLHLYSQNTPGFPNPASNAIYELFTNGNNFNNSNGLQIGLNANGNAEIRQRQNLNMNFYTNDLQRMTILNTGLVGINETTPTSIFQITEATGAEQLKLSFDVNTRTTLRTTAAGHLIIWPRKNNNIDGRVAIWGGINNAGPDYTLHVSGTIGVEDMDPAITPVTTWPVLWDEDTHQLIKGTAPVGSEVSVCSAYTSADDNYLTKWKNGIPEICRSNVFDNGTSVMIGTTTPLAVFSVQNASLIYNVGISSFITGSTTQNSVGLFSGLLATGAPVNRGLWNNVSGSSPVNIGSDSWARQATTNIGGAYFAYNNNIFPIYPTSGNYGVYSKVQGSSSSFSNNYAIYGDASSNLNNYAGYFNGNVYATGTITELSDSTLKNIVLN